MNRHLRGAPPRLHPTGLDRSHQEFLGLPVVGAHLAAGLRVSVLRSEMDRERAAESICCRRINKT